MLVDDGFIQRFDVCEETAALIRQNNLLGKEVSEVLRALRDLGVLEPTVWWQDQKKTEQYVRANGKEITMTESFQVFNPFTGQHTEYFGEDAAREAALEITKQILKTHKVSICRTIKNENGDTAWTAVEFSNPIQAV